MVIRELHKIHVFASKKWPFPIDVNNIAGSFPQNSPTSKLQSRRRFCHCFVFVLILMYNVNSILLFFRSVSHSKRTNTKQLAFVFFFCDTKKEETNYQLATRIGRWMACQYSQQIECFNFMCFLFSMFCVYLFRSVISSTIPSRCAPKKHIFYLVQAFMTIKILKTWFNLVIVGYFSCESAIIFFRLSYFPFSVQINIQEFSLGRSKTEIRQENGKHKMWFI